MSNFQKMMLTLAILLVACAGVSFSLIDELVIAALPVDPYVEVWDEHVVRRGEIVYGDLTHHANTTYVGGKLVDPTNAGMLSNGGSVAFTFDISLGLKTKMNFGKSLNLL